MTSGTGTGQPTVTLTYGYNGTHDLTSVTDSLSTAGRITTTYDAAHRVVSLQQSFGASAGPYVDLSVRRRQPVDDDRAHDRRSGDQGPDRRELRQCGPNHHPDPLQGGDTGFAAGRHGHSAGDLRLRLRRGGPADDPGRRRRHGNLHLRRHRPADRRGRLANRELRIRCQRQPKHDRIHGELRETNTQAAGASPTPTTPKAIKPARPRWPPETSGPTRSTSTTG